MAGRRADPTQGSWVEAIAAASGKSTELVRIFLDRHDLRPQGLIPRPVDLTVRTLSFGGVKRVDGREEPFVFEWGDLSSGLWLIGSGRNSRGKTSLLGIVRWLLRGTPPEAIPPDVFAWIRHAELDFDLDGVRHRVSVDLRDGYGASLIEVREDARPIFEATDASQFATAMSDFMLRALSLEPVTGLRRDDDLTGRTIHHRWPALFGAFHIGTDYSVLIGDVMLDALPNRMLNMFAGFPHAAAVARMVHVTTKLALVDNNETRILRSIANHAKVRAARLRGELASMDDGATVHETAAELLASMRSASEEVARSYASLQQLRRALDDAEKAVAIARASWNEDRLALRNFVEDRAATRVFRSLDPTCCPRCDHTFGADRKARERVERACMVCGEAAPMDDPVGAAAAQDRLEEDERLGGRAHEIAREAEAEARAVVHAAEENVTALEKRIEVDRARQAAASEKETDLTRRAVLEAMIAQADQDAGAEEAQEESDETLIAKAAEKVFRRRLKLEQEEVIGEVQSEMLEFLRGLGVANLTGVELTTSPQLALLKGEERVPFGKAAIGDQMRSKVALIVALMKVARRRGVGSHPGLLFIDTPGAQEMANEDLVVLAAGMAALCRELPSLQIFVATQRFEAFEEVVDPEHRLVAKGNDILW